MNHRPSDARTTPTQSSVDAGGDGPADGAGKTRNQGNARDRTARCCAIDARQCGKCGVVQPHAHPNTKHDPRKDQHWHVLCHGQ